MDLQLRPYQESAIQKTLEAIAQNKSNKQVWVMATGTGKTVCFAKLASHIINKTGKKVLILAHREELLNQAKDKILRTDSLLRVGIEQAENKISMSPAEYNSNYFQPEGSHQTNPDVIVASIPTLGREGSTRIKKFNPRDFGLIVVDEAHHASATSYINVLKYFGVLKMRQAIETAGQDILGGEDNDWNKECLLLGVTATPSRSDNRGIDTIFDDVVFEYNIIQAIKESYLSPVRGMRIRTAVDLSNVGKTAGDFNIGELEEAVNVEDRNELIVKAYKEIIPGKQALVFAVNIEHAFALTEMFTAAEINASFVIGSTDKETRVQRLSDFNNKKINVMVNVGVLTEGVDIPSVDAVLMARPTTSGILYSQMLGRGTRLYPGKEHLMVIDFVDNTKKARLQTVASLLGKPQAIDFQGRDILDVQQELDELQEIAPGLDLENVDVTKIQQLIEKAKYNIEEVDLLGSLRVAPPLAAYSKYEWQKYNEDTYRLGLGVSRETGIKLSFSISETVTEKFVVRKHTIDTQVKKDAEISEVGSYPDIETAVREADLYIQVNHHDSLTLVASNARWRKEKPSDKQITWLKKFNVAPDVIEKMTKGDATRALSKFFASKPKPQSQGRMF